MTNWTKRLILFIRSVDLTANERRLLRRAFSDNQSGESEMGEDKAFDNSAKFSVNGKLPAEVIAINTLTKHDILLALLARANAMSQSLWYVTSNKGGLLETNDADITPNGQKWDWQDAVARLEVLKGLKVINETV